MHAAAMRKPLLITSLTRVLTATPHSSLLPRCLPFSTAVPDDGGGGGGVLVKKVTRSNFEAALEELRARVHESDFVAIDLKMTGVTSAPWRDAYEFDRSDVRYLKVKDSVDKFAVLQFGVCPFRWDSTKESFVAHPHNFYIFPRKELPFGGPSDEFHCQTSTIDFLVVEKNFNDLIYICATGHELSEQKLVVYTDSKSDKTLLMEEVHNDLLHMYKAKLGSAVGFRHVVDFISSEEKLLVGHNCFLDIAHVYKKFVGPLPSSITEFASAVHKIFPHIVDTTHLLKVDPVLQRLMKKSITSLSSAFSLLCPYVPFASQGSGSAHSYIKIDVQMDISGSHSGAKHEAGYDAFMTGCVFAQGCHHLGVDFKLLSTSKDLVQNAKLRKHINILYPSWNAGTVINLQTGCEVPESGLQPYRRRYPKMVYDDTVILWGFPLNIKPMELKQCLCKVFGANSVSSIFYVDATAALIQFCKKELATDFLLLKDHLERNNNAISVLHPLSKLLGGGNTCAADYETYKQLCSSPMSKTSFAEQAEAVGIRWKTKIDPARLEARESAGCSESTELEADNFPSSGEGNGKTEYASSAVAKAATGNLSSKKMERPHHVSCEDILDSLYASRALLGRRTNC